MESQKTRRLSAIMFTDIVGYTAMMQSDEQAAAKARAHHRSVFDVAHHKHEGQILQYYGDGTLSVFQSAVRAVECAIAIQRALREGESVPLRIGLHLGDIVFDGTEVYGDGVNLCSRIESMGVAGAILLTKTINDELSNHPHLTTVSLGKFGLKNVAEPIEVFAVSGEGVKVPERSALKGKQTLLNKTVAVLPFVNMSASEENEYFSDGMTEEIINALAKIEGLKVTSRTSSFFFKNKNIPINQIGKALNVAIILEGSVRLAGNQMRITAQLIDVQDDYHFWSETFDRPLDNIFAVQDEISLLIADKLREHIGHFEIKDHLVEQPNVPVGAYQRYLKGRYHILKMTKQGMEEGIAILEGITKEQPDYAMAYLGLNMAYTLIGTLGLLPAAEAFGKGHSYLEKAIALNPDLPDCQLQQAWSCFLQHWDFAGTYRHLEKVREAQPIIDYYQTMASTLVAEGRFKAAFSFIDTALQIDPFSAINYHLKGFIYYSQRKYEEAIEWFEKSVNLKADSTVSILYLGQALLLNGRAEEGLKYFESLPDDEEGDLKKLGGTTLAYATLDDKARANAGVRLLREALQTDMMGRAMNMLILCETMLGNHESALDLIEEGIQKRLPMMVYLPIEPMLKPLHGSDRYQALMKQIMGERAEVEPLRKKYKKALFSKEEMLAYRDQLKQLMEVETPYLDSGLTLRSLAEQMGLTANQLSQLLNKGFDQNFSEFINSYRLEAFKTKAADPAQQHLTILALAYDSGFNSKTAFNTFFKKAMGKTPSAYWKELVK